MVGKPIHVNGKKGGIHKRMPPFLSYVVLRMDFGAGDYSPMSFVSCSKVLATGISA